MGLVSLYINGFGAKIIFSSLIMILFSHYVVVGSSSVSVPPNSHFLKEIFNDPLDWLGWCEDTPHIYILSLSKWKQLGTQLVIEVKAAWNTTEEKEMRSYDSPGKS